MTDQNIDVCDQLMEILGKPRPTNAELLIRLIDALEEKPELDSFNERHCDYWFRKSGIRLQFDNELGIFDQLFLELRTFDFEDCRPYGGKLPYGINRDDSADAVEAKLPGSTMQLKDYRFDKDLRPLVVRFEFLASDFNEPGFGEKRLRLVYVDWVDAARDPNKAASLGYDVRQT